MLFPKPLILLWQSTRPQVKKTRALTPKQELKEPLLP
jgi:V-type H+-transporting ATPase subunit a